MTTLPISEIFASIQGEGGFIGVPSTFVRVSGCNLRCVWCDTPYASWHPDGKVLSVDQIVEEVGSLGLKDVVVTGGEPMLFEGVSELTIRLKSLGHRITIETAGTVDRDVKCDLISISPKLAHSAPSGEMRVRHEASRWRPDVVQSLMSRFDYQLKFVVGADVEKDVEEIEAALIQYDFADPGRVYLMPEGTDAAELMSRMRDLVGPCMAKGWRLAPRLHVELFGNTRGT